jgi:ribosomal protein L11 methyltransferase
MLAFVLVVDPDDVEYASDLLWGWGVVAVEERPGPAGATELWTALGEDREAIADLTAELPERWSWKLVEVDSTAADTWREFARPVVVNDRLIVAPAWYGTVDAEPGQRVVRIEPGPTFGMGDHPTTVSSMRSLLAELDHRPANRVLDVGCGSGVLAVVACLFGVDEAVAIDVSPASPEITIANAQANGVGHQIFVSCDPLDEIGAEFDLVMANILAPVLIELSAGLTRSVAPEGTLILSGLLEDRYDDVVAAMTGFTVVAIERMDGWVALTLRRSTR